MFEKKQFNKITIITIALAACLLVLSIGSLNSYVFVCISSFSLLLLSLLLLFYVNIMHIF